MIGSLLFTRAVHMAIKCCCVCVSDADCGTIKIRIYIYNYTYNTTHTQPVLRAFLLLLFVRFSARFCIDLWFVLCIYVYSPFRVSIIFTKLITFAAAYKYSFVAVANICARTF